MAAACLGVFSYGLLRLLHSLSGVYDYVTGRPATIRQNVPWLRSLRDERPHETGPEYSL